MLKSTKYFVLPVIVLILCSVLVLAYHGWRQLEEGGYYSCIASIASEIQKSDTAKSLSANNKDWKILSEKEVNSLMSQIHGNDCGRVSNQTLDIWNNKINIALRKPKDTLEVIVWSKGSDEISGTADDLVIPYGE
jgi:hypothetical protein